MRWPYLFIFPFCIALITVSVYVKNLKIFETDAILLFENNYVPIEEYFSVLDKFEEQPTQIVRSLFYGKPAQGIVLKVWPELEGNLPAINSKIVHLRSRNGVNLNFRRDNQNALLITYKHTDPHLSYNVVKATIDTIVKQNKDLTQNKLNTGVKFLNEELEKARQELASLEAEIVRLRSGLPLSVLENLEEYSQDVDEILDLVPIDLDIEKKLGSSLNLNRSVDELEFEYRILQQELSELKKDLDTRAFVNDPGNLEVILEVSKNPEIVNLNNEIFNKRTALNSLLSQGLKDAHPDVLKLKKEIDNLLAFKQEKLLKIQAKHGKTNSELTNLRLEKIHRDKIEQKNKELDILRDQIQATKAYQAKFKQENLSLDQKLQELSARKSKLLELENKKIVTAHSYAQMAKRLAVFKREGRIDQDKFGLNTRIAEAPELPLKPLRYAGFSIVLMVMSVTTFLLLAIAILILFLDNKFYNAREYEKVIGIPVLGNVDTFDLKSQQRNRRLKLVIFIAIIVVYTYLVWNI